MSERRSIFSWVAVVFVAVAAGWLFARAEVVTQRLLWNSVLLSCAVGAISLPIGTLLALFLVRTDLPGRHGGLVVLAVLLFMPLYLQAAGWDAGFGRQGWYSYAVTTVAAPVLAGWRAAIWIHALAAVPWTVAIVGAGLRFVEGWVGLFGVLMVVPLLARKQCGIANRDGSPTSTDIAEHGTRIATRRGLLHCLRASSGSRRMDRQSWVRTQLVLADDVEWSSAMQELRRNKSGWQGAFD